MNITETIFANDDPDTTQLTNGVFKTDARGLAIFYLTNQKRVDVLFTKAGVTSVTIPVDVQKSSLVSGYATFQDEGTAQTQRAIANFTGAGVTLTDDAANGRTNVTISASGETVAASTIWDAAGDLAKGTGADTAARLARGSAGQFLRVNTAGTDIAWADPTSDSALVVTAETTTSTSFADLATAGPAVTIDVGASGRALVVVSGQIRSSVGPTNPLMAYAISGASTVAAADGRSLWWSPTTTGVYLQASFAYIEEGLTAGSNTFTAKYRTATAGTVEFAERRISVVAL